MSALDKRRIAYHEAGHTIAQLEYAPITRQRFAKVTLMRYGNFGAGVGGFSSTKPTEETFGGASTREEVLADIRVSLGSRAAEEVFLNTRLSGVGGDFGNATTDAANYLFRWGMDGNIINPFVFTPQMDVDQAMQDKIEALLQEQYTEVKALIERRRDEVEAIAEELIQRDELNSQDVEEILKRVAFAKRIAGNGAHNGSAEDTLLSNLLAAGDLDWREPADMPDPTPVAEPEPEPQLEKLLDAIFNAKAQGRKANNQNVTKVHEDILLEVFVSCAVVATFASLRLCVKSGSGGAAGPFSAWRSPSASVWPVP